MIHALSRHVKAIFLTFLLSNFSLYAGNGIQLLLKTGTVKVEAQSSDIIKNNGLKYEGQYVLLTFNEIPNFQEKLDLKETGINLGNYLPKNTFYAFLKKGLKVDELIKYKIHSINVIKNEYKIHPEFKDELPEWMYTGKEVKMMLNCFDFKRLDELTTSLKKINIAIDSIKPESQLIFIHSKLESLETIASLPTVHFISPIDGPTFPENYGGRTQHRSNMLAQEFASGNKYDGTGVNVGMHDDGIIGPHIDYEGRIAQTFTTNNSGNHGDHVSGTIMGAGNLNPKGRGMAFGSDLYVYSSSNNNYNDAVTHYNTYGVVIVSKSYSDGCNKGYTGLTQQLDSQIFQNSSLIHVFSAGNNGTSACTGVFNYGAGATWGNITGGHKMGKNVITTGNLTSSDQLAASSSRGPAHDGRIKPDICAKGTSVFSTIAVNDYDTYTGTSMACPGISGSLSQLYHAYKSLNGNVNPPSGLIKGTVLNTADDIGNPGPDFKHGWGRINLRRALNVLENSQYISSTLSSSSSNVHNISVPSGVEQVRIMVYWHDYQGDVSTSRALVNNIDMTVTDPSNNVYLPWVLNPAPNGATLDSNAKRAVDTLNNMEQVTIDNPAQGTYVVTLDPTSIPKGPQPYFLIYEFIFNEIYVTYPNGGEGLAPGENEIIRWDASVSPSTFDIQYSTNGGVSWTNIATSVAGNLRQYSWNVPNNVTDQVKVRVVRGLISDESDQNFSIVGVPVNLQVDWVCPDSMQLSWNNVTSAIGYRTYMLGAKYMDSVSTTSTNSYVYHNTNFQNQYWLSVSANPSTNATGRRAIAIQSQIGIKNCPLKNDAAIPSFKSPQPGTYLSCVNDEFEISFYIKNVGINAISNVPYEVWSNLGIMASSSYSGTLQPGDSVLVILSPLAVPFGLNINVYVKYPLDLNNYNDTIQSAYIYKSTTSVSPPWSENFENFTACGIDNDCGNTRCQAYNGWTNDSTYLVDQHDWRTDLGGTGSGGTGPSIDHNPGNATGNYMYTEASSDCFFKTAILTSPCLDITESSMPRFTFWYHMRGVEMGELHIDLLTADGWILDIIASHSGDLGDVWFKDSIDLTPYTGEMVNVRFRGITGVGYRSDMAIDDISLVETDPYFGIESKELADIRLYPNPSKNIFYLEITDYLYNKTIQVTDLTGKKLIDEKNMKYDGQRYVIDMTSFDQGVYFLNFYVNDKLQTKKLVKY